MYETEFWQINTNSRCSTRVFKPSIRSYIGGSNSIIQFKLLFPFEFKPFKFRISLACCLTAKTCPNSEKSKTAAKYWPIPIQKQTSIVIHPLWLRIIYFSETDQFEVVIAILVVQQLRSKNVMFPTNFEDRLILIFLSSLDLELMNNARSPKIWAP